MEADWILRSMRKRRVGVTARSRQNDGNQGTGTPQFATEMAAPLEIRTPAGTCGKSCNQSADGSLAKKAQQTTCRIQLREVRVGRGEFSEGCRSGALRAHEALPHTPPGGKPPETLAPFPWRSMLQNGSFLSRVRKPRQTIKPSRARLKSGAPLTESFRSEETTGMRERGPSELGIDTVASHPLSQRGGDGALRAHEAPPHTPLGASPLRPPAVFA